MALILLLEFTPSTGQIGCPSQVMDELVYSLFYFFSILNCNIALVGLNDINYTLNDEDWFFYCKGPTTNCPIIYLIEREGKKKHSYFLETMLLFKFSLFLPLSIYQKYLSYFFTMFYNYYSNIYF